MRDICGGSFRKKHKQIECNRAANGKRVIWAHYKSVIYAVASQTTTVSILIVCLRVGVWCTAHAATRPSNDVYHLTKRRDALAKMKCNMRKINWNPNRFTQFYSSNYLCSNSRRQTMHVWSVCRFSAAKHSHTVCIQHTRHSVHCFAEFSADRWKWWRRRTAHIHRAPKSNLKMISKPFQAFIIIGLQTISLSSSKHRHADTLGH